MAHSILHSCLANQAVMLAGGVRGRRDDVYAAGDRGHASALSDMGKNARRFLARAAVWWLQMFDLAALVVPMWA